MVAYKGMPKSTHPELEYMARVKELPCCNCLPGEQISATQCHHITDGGRRLGNFYCLPLCDICHKNVHLLRNGVERTFWEQVNQTLGIEREWIGTKILARPTLNFRGRDWLNKVMP